MTINEQSLRELLCQRLCQDVGIDRRPDGALMLRTQFRLPDGDGLSIHLAEAPGGGLRLSDRGHTLMHISYEHDVDAFMEGTRGALLERIVAEGGMQQHGGEFFIDTVAERLPEALFQLGASAHPSLRSHLPLAPATTSTASCCGAIPTSSRTARRGARTRRGRAGTRSRRRHRLGGWASSCMRWSTRSG